MNTTELIELLKSVEFGASGRPREISISFNSEGMFFPNPEFNIESTGDGIAGAELGLEITGEVWKENSKDEELYYIKFSENQYAQKFNENKIDSILINDKIMAGQFTKREIQMINPDLMTFAVEVAE